MGVQYKEYTGKTVFHCHFLAHEDTGMMSTLFIGPQDFSWWRWKDDNIHRLFGISLGIIIGFGVWLLGIRLCCRQNQTTHHHAYTAVATMTGLKSKVMD